MPQAMRVSNARQYNRILKARGKVFSLMKRILLTQRGNIGNKGRLKKYPDQLIVTMYQVAYMLCLSLRQVCGFFEDYVEQHNLKLDIPDYSTLSKRLQTLNIAFKSPNTQPIDIAIDSSTMSIYNNTGTHSKHNGQSRQSFRYEQTRKMHVSVNLKNKKVCSYYYSHGTMVDHRGLAPLVDRIEIPIRTIRADRAYDRKPCYEKCFQQNIQAIIPPMRTAVLRNEVIFAERNKALQTVKADKDYETGIRYWKNKKAYGNRSYVESFFSRFKMIFGFSFKNKHEQCRENELGIKCKLLNNLIDLGMPRFELV